MKAYLHEFELVCVRVATDGTEYSTARTLSAVISVLLRALSLKRAWENQAALTVIVAGSEMSRSHMGSLARDADETHIMLRMKALQIMRNGDTQEIMDGLFFLSQYDR
ncbi:hypothetical protein EW146_g3314 [Bondarzewia mesenterica]|uniref:Uncharacterized protein n=1 Tax=Bondarzewia mesenterica TaxID=1095465 RepID=A0A4S4LXY3_9AGAM|nr:hypothetical protein EW146_g3314 [Bondarzewia mesenterica]